MESESSFPPPRWWWLQSRANSSSRQIPANSDERKKEFRAGDASAVGTWHTLSLRAGDDDRMNFMIDGIAVGSLPNYDVRAPTKWYLFLSAWSSDGQVVEGSIDDVDIDCAGSRR